MSKLQDTNVSSSTNGRPHTGCALKARRRARTATVMLFAGVAAVFAGVKLYNDGPVAARAGVGGLGRATSVAPAVTRSTTTPPGESSRPAPAPMPAEVAQYVALYQRPTEIPYPDENKYTPARELLGKTLFFDPRLSGSGILSCASCHNPSLSWGDGMPVGVGHGMNKLGRRTPTVLNLAWTELLFWDGRAGSLEEQALGPIQSKGEMNMDLDSMIAAVRGVKGYAPLFANAYPGEPVDQHTVARAIATFERGVVSTRAPFDDFLAGNAGAISPAAQRGFVLFNGKAQCAQCHTGWSFSDGGFHDIGVVGTDVGRSKILPLPSMKSAFKTPTLRDVARRGPYMHDGSEKTLAEVVDLYDAGGREKRASLSPMIKPLGLTPGEKADLVAFMETLTGEDARVTVPELPR